MRVQKKCGHENPSHADIRIAIMAEPLLGKSDSIERENTGYKIKAYTGGAAETSPAYATAYTAGDTVIALALWLTSNIGILLLNKYILGNFGFGYPIFLTECHMLACTLLAEAGHYSGLVRPMPVQSYKHLLKVCVLAGAFLLSVVLNNVALRFIPVSFVEEIGTLTPVATAVLAFICLGTVERTETYGALIPVVLGIIMASGYELSFNSIGFAAAVAGCLARALKTVLQAVLLSSEREGMDSMSVLRLMAPIAALMLVPAVVVLEPDAPGAVLRLLRTQSSFGLLLIANSSLAYIVNYTSFKITKVTSPLSLQVLGCSKGVLATLVSIILFGNQISSLGAVGYSITVSGVLAYGLSKHRTFITHST